MNGTHYSEYEVKTQHELGSHHNVTRCPSDLIRLDCGSTGHEEPFASLSVSSTKQIECPWHCLRSQRRLGIVYGESDAYDAASSICLAALHSGLISLNGVAPGYDPNQSTFTQIPQTCSASIDIVIMFDASSGLSTPDYQSQTSGVSTSHYGFFFKL